MNTSSLCKRMLAIIISLMFVLFMPGCHYIELLTAHDEEIYECTNVDEYGTFVGNFDNTFPQEFIASFFPETISTDFSNVVYSYRAMRWDDYRFEAYLEFHIEDKNAYRSYISAICDEAQWADFGFDKKYREYIISDEYELDVYKDEEFVDYAKIGKILCCDEDQTVIYIALASPRCCPYNPEYFQTFFNRFDISPMEYAQALKQT